VGGTRRRRARSGRCQPGRDPPLRRLPGRARDAQRRERVLDLQAAIAAVHAEAATYEDTDWRQITVLYGMLHRIAPGPAVTLNHAVAAAMVHGPSTGLALLDPLAADPAMRRHHRLYAVRAHLHESVGHPEAAAEDYRRAAQLTTSLPEQCYLNRRLARLTEPGRP
jgi:predicted RNA polymerase sigma factor